jgi:hypothetical protein
MNGPDRKFDELRDLVARMREEQWTPSDALRLKQILTDSPEARQAYAEYVALGALLELEAAAIFPDAKLADVLRSPQAETLPAETLPAAAIPTGTSPAMAEEAANAKNAGSPAKSPILGFLGGVIDYVNHSRTLMFWLMALTVSGWFLFQLGSLMLGRARPGGAQVAAQPADRNSPDVSHPPGGPFAIPTSPRQSDSVAWMTAIVDCHWRVVPLAVPPALAPAPGDVDTALDADHLFHVGSELSAGQQLDLVRGLAEITFRSGARIVLNGPARPIRASANPTPSSGPAPSATE